MKKLYVKPSILIVLDSVNKNATIIKMNLISKNTYIIYLPAFMAAGKIIVLL